MAAGLVPRSLEPCNRTPLFDECCQNVATGRVNQTQGIMAASKPPISSSFSSADESVWLQEIVD